jgi:hypothetical protein
MSCEMAIINLSPTEYRSLATILGCAPTNDGLTHGDGKPRGASRKAHDTYFNAGVNGGARDDAMDGFYFIDVRLTDAVTNSLIDWVSEGNRWSKVRRLDGVNIACDLEILKKPGSFDHVKTYITECQKRFVGNKFKVELYFSF